MLSWECIKHCFLVQSELDTLLFKSDDSEVLLHIFFEEYTSVIL